MPTDCSWSICWRNVGYNFTWTLYGVAQMASVCFPVPFFYLMHPHKPTDTNAVSVLIFHCLLPFSIVFSSLELYNPLSWGHIFFYWQNKSLSTQFYAHENIYIFFHRVEMLCSCYGRIALYFKVVTGNDFSVSLGKNSVMTCQHNVIEVVWGEIRLLRLH